MRLGFDGLTGYVRRHDCVSSPTAPYTTFQYARWLAGDFKAVEIEWDGEQVTVARIDEMPRG